MNNIGELLYKVRDIMDKEFIKVTTDENNIDTFNKMVEMNKDEAIIVDNNGKLAGIITRKDFAKFKKEKRLSFEECNLRYVTSNILTIGPDASARIARNIMIVNNIGRLPVIENDEVIGVITSNNLRDTFYVRINELFDLHNEIMDNVHEAICICNSTGIVTYWNKSAEKLYSIKSEDIVGKHIDTFFPNALTSIVLREKKPVENVQHEPVKGKSVILSAIPIFNADNELIAVVTTDRDVTDVVSLSYQLERERKRAEFLENAYQAEIASKYNFDNILGKDKKIIESIALIQKVAPTSTSVLITGESGTGKEVFSRAIHEASGRSGHFVAVNCSAIPGNLLESELFGYVEGAFTGAVKKGKIGKFEFASGGTLFLDEIGDMPIDMQAKLLRVLQDGVIYRLGSEKPILTNTRIVAATNKDLKKLVKEDKFREDLFYRLAVVQIELPPLRERKDDIGGLALQFINEISQQENISIRNIDPKIYSILKEYKWEGNIRELKNVVQRMVVLSNNGEINVESIPSYISECNSKSKVSMIGEYDLEKVVEHIERDMIVKVLQLTRGNKLKAAEMLKIKRSTLYYKLQRYEIE
jgi:PAS domain S-box-containing protein